MIFIKVVNGIIVEYVNNELSLRNKFTNVALPVDLTNCEYLIEQNWHVVNEVERPSYNNITESLLAGDLILVDGLWYQSWIIQPLDALTIAENQTNALNILQDQLDLVVTEHMESIARSLGYSNRLSIISYLSSEIPKFKNEAMAFNSWRDQVWLTCLNIQSQVLAGTMELPTADSILAALPEFTL